MKKRLRKKLHKGEFQQFGISIFVPSDLDNAEKQLNTIIDVADSNNVLFIGGGLGYFSMPSEEYNDLDIPKKIENLIMYAALNDTTQLGGIIGYFINPFEKEISKNVAEKIKSKLEADLKIDFKIHLRIDLWN
jgi:hypothetical protein